MRQADPDQRAMPDIGQSRPFFFPEQPRPRIQRLAAPPALSDEVAGKALTKGSPQDWQILHGPHNSESGEAGVELLHSRTGADSVPESTR